MFDTNRRVKLSEFSEFFDEIRRDIDFYSIGKIPTRVPCRLVPVGELRHIKEASSYSDIVGFICPEELVDHIPREMGCAISHRPVESAFRIHQNLCSRRDYFWKSYKSVISPDAVIHPRAYVDPDNVQIGPGTYIGANAVIQQNTIIGSRCRVGAGTVIGSDAYEIASIDGHNMLQAHAGGVWIGNDVIFCSNCTVARSIYPAFTRIGDECSFDNLVHVAHDCELQQGCKMTACSMLSGRVDLDEGAYLGPNSTISNGLRVGKKGVVTIGSTVVRNVKDGSRVTGNFAIDHDRFIHNLKTSTRSKD